MHMNSFIACVVARLRERDPHNSRHYSHSQEINTYVALLFFYWLVYIIICVSVQQDAKYR